MKSTVLTIFSMIIIKIHIFYIFYILRISSHKMLIGWLINTVYSFLYFAYNLWFKSTKHSSLYCSTDTSLTVVFLMRCISMADKQGDSRIPASVHGCCAAPWRKPWCWHSKVSEITAQRQMKVCFTRSRTDPEALAEVMSREKLTGDALDHDRAAILI